MNTINTICGRVQRITPLNHGDFFPLGNNSNEADVGGWTITLMPDATTGFDGTIAIVRRPEGNEASINGVGYMQSPYRRIVVNGAASDGLMDSIPLVGPTEVQVPANGTSIGFIVYCTTGSGNVYSRPLQGCTAF